MGAESVDLVNQMAVLFTASNAFRVFIPPDEITHDNLKTDSNKHTTPSTRSTGFKKHQ